MQTTIQKAEAIRKGSVLVQVGDNFSALVDIGAIRSPKLTMLTENQEIKFDNVDSLKQFAEGDKVKFDFTLAEINLTNLAKFDKGLITLSSVAGNSTPVTGEAHGTGWTVALPIKLTNKNGDNTIVGSIVVKAGGSTITLNTDYKTYVGDGSNGELGATYIVPLTAQTLAITVDYAYVPNASKKIVFARSGTKTDIVCRVINTDANGKTFKIDIDEVTNVQAPDITFPADDDAEVASTPISLEGRIVEIVDEQQTT